MNTANSLRRQLSLQEWLPAPLELATEELEDLRTAGADLLIQPLGGRNYLVQPRSTVGSFTTPRLRVLIRPKFDVTRVLHLMLNGRGIRIALETTELGQREEFTEGFVALFLNLLRRRLRRGLLMGYVTLDESLTTIRGRIRTADQLRRRFALPLPVEVTYDDYSADITENRLLKAALRKLADLRLPSPLLRSRIAETLAAFDVVRDVPLRHDRLPTVHYTRLNEPYRSVLQLAAMILETTAIDLQTGQRTTSSFLVDMNSVFEDFVFESLRRRLARHFAPNDAWQQGQAIALDEQGVLCPEPDLAWWRGARCLYVGDAKYKRTAEGHLSDLYQLLAYCTATGLDEGLLVYAEQRGGPAVHRVLHSGQRLHVMAIDLETPTDALERRCDDLATRVLAMASRAAGASRLVPSVGHR